jgi:hypothetical protein
LAHQVSSDGNQITADALHQISMNESPLQSNAHQHHQVPPQPSMSIHNDGFQGGGASNGLHIDIPAHIKTLSFNNSNSNAGQSPQLSKF